MPHILVVDDDLEIRQLLGRYLKEQGFRVSLASNRREFLERIAVERIDLAVLDVMLPDGSGLDLARSLQGRNPSIPVILLTALKEEIDRVIGLEMGADDYLGKPFSPRELLARIRAVLRRHGDLQPADPQLVFRFGDFVAEPATQGVRSTNGGDVELTGAEFQLLRVFLERPGRVLSRDQLLDLTKGRQSGAFDRSIDVMVSRLRRKLAEASPLPVIKTVRNGGYQMVVRVERSGAVA
ncbi:MAG: response regulator transcription factor [Devosia sp.]|nr:response regulator transcription factor [Devosia sp.]